MEYFTMIKMISGRTLYIKEWWTKEEVIKFEKVTITKLWFLIQHGRIELYGEDEIEKIIVNEIAFARRLSI